MRNGRPRIGIDARKVKDFGIGAYIRNLVEAILWHGGEAEAARDAFAQMSQATRDDLVAFLESL